MSGYLFVHFIGEQKDGEQIYFSLSRDGLHFKDLNHGQPILYSRVGEQGGRDPFLVRDEKSGTYFLIATDLRIEAGKGWEAAQTNGSRHIIVWESDDLIHWSAERRCEVGPLDAGCVWAPEVVYDHGKEAFLIFFASRVKETDGTFGKQKIYGVYTTDFKTYSDPFLYIERENHIIDTTIVEEGGIYYRFSKDETTKRITIDYSDCLTGHDFKPIDSKTLDALEGVEGPECFRLPDGNWCLIVDRFAEGKGYLPLITSDLSSGEWQVLSDEAFDFGQTKKRHGGVLKLTDEEYERLWQAYGDENPVLPGLYADPDLVMFNEKYYLYPTTDGFEGWSGTEFFAFSSDDGIHFKNEGKILDVACDEVPWATGCAWAPCMAKRNGKYYFYFCAKNREGTSCIGVASADTPTGPFYAEKSPLITMELMKEHNLLMGQTIDPSIYSEDGKFFLLFGNGYPAIVELEEDMVHIKEHTLQNLEGAFDFREAIMVLKRDDTYHFTWSCDDTGSENYHVNYGISKNLFGPIDYQYSVLEKDENCDILGTGHHSILNIGDRYVMAYHRFATPLAKYPEGKGFHREVCLGEVTFSDEGFMQKLIY